MDNWFQKLTSNLDFWDREENKRQNAEFARQDEEERRRKAQQGAARSSVSRQAPAAGPVRQQQDFDFTKPLLKVGSQSDVAEDAVDDVTFGGKSYTKRSPQQEMQDLIEKNRPQAEAEAKQDSSWLARATVDRGWKDRAEMNARTKAAREYSLKYGYNKQPEVMDSLNRAQEIGGELAEKSEKLGKFLDKGEAATIKAAQIGSYVPITGSVLNLGLAGAEKLQKATGNKAAGDATAEQRLKIDLDMDQKQFDELDDETKGKLRTLQNLGLGLAPLDFLGAGGLAKSGVVGAGKKAAMELIEKGAIETVTKDALKKAALTAGKDAAVAGAVGTAMSAGAQKYLSDEIDPLEAFKTGGLVAATTGLTPNEGKKAAMESAEEAVKMPGVRKGVQAASEEAVEVGSGIKSTNVAKVAKENSAKAIEDVAVRAPTEQIDELGGRTPEDLPNIRQQEQAESEALRKATDLPANVVDDETPVPQILNRAPEEAVDEIQAGFVGDPNIPDVTNPYALAKGDDSIPAPTVPFVDDAPMADFSRAIEAGRLEKAVPEEMAPPVLPVAEPTAADLEAAANAGELPIPTQLDAEGNPIMVSDADAARQLAEQGIVADRGDSVVAATENARAAAAEQAAREQVNLEGAAAPNTRLQITNRIADDELRADLNMNVPRGEAVSLEQAENTAKAFINDLSDEALIGRFGDEVKVSDPQGFYTALNAIKRLEQIDAPEAAGAIRNALDAMAEYAAESGRGLRTVQTVFEDMPTTMKHDYLVNSLERKTGAELPDLQRQQLLALIERSDEATDGLRKLEDEANNLLDSGVINNKSLEPEVKARAAALIGEIEVAAKQKEMFSNDAYKFYSQQLPPSPLGKRVADVGRTLMLSSPAGRVFDVVSTTMTTADDIANRGVSSLIGKAVNLIKGPGTVTDTVPSASRLAKGFRQGVDETVDALRGQGRTEDFMREASRATRGDINEGGGKVRQLIRALVEAPTNFTKGLRNDELYRQGMQEAAKLGLNGDAQSVYADLRSAVPSKEQLHQAIEVHMKANMLHDNAISRSLNKLADSLDTKGGGWGAALIRNQVAPFTSWLGGNLHRTLTDKNMLYNVGSAVDNFRKGNVQGAIDDISRFAVNGGQAYAGGYLLTQAGILTNEDANGDSYGGVYFHIGDRYIPVAIAGTAAVPLILGNAVHQGVEEGGDATDIIAAVINQGGMNALKNAGVASVFGGENNLQTAVSEATREGGDLFNAAAQYGGGLLRQYIPGATGDINAVIDSTGVNPTGEAAETRVTAENPETGREKTDVFATEIAKTMARLPGLAQTLPRKEGVLAKDILDRMLKGNREGEAGKADREQKESLKDMEKRLRAEKVPLKDDDIQGALDDGDYEKATKGLQYKLAKAEADPDASESSKKKIRDELTQAELQSNGVPVTEEGIKARTEEGDWDRAIAGLQYQAQKLADDKNTPPSKKKEVQDNITRIQITKDGEYPASVIQQYSDTSQSEWRAMGNPASEDYDPELYELLYSYDAALAEKGVSRSTKSGDKQKYAAKGSGSGRGGSGGGRKQSVDIATQSFKGASFAPQKPIAATVGEAKSSIPKLQKVPNNDRSKLKKVTVTKGGRS